LWLISKITSPLTYPIRFALYLIQLGLYAIFRAFQRALVLSAYVYPEPDMLADPLAQQFINPSPDRMLRNPYLEYPMERDHSLFFPLSGLEDLTMLPGPYGHAGINYPYWFIDGEPADQTVENGLVTAASIADTVKQTDPLQVNAAVGGPPYRGALGAAVGFFLRRAHEVQAAGGDSTKLVLPDWNLDADRGYGVRCWEALSSLDSPPQGGVTIQYV